MGIVKNLDGVAVQNGDDLTRELIDREYREKGRIVLLACRLHLSLGRERLPCEASKKRAAPYTKIVEALPEMRRETVELANTAVAEGR